VKDTDNIIELNHKWARTSLLGIFQEKLMEPPTNINVDIDTLLWA
jgi:hypothetical protein